MIDTTYICIRETVEWADEAAFRAQLVPEFAPTVDLWDATFNIPYHLFRNRARDIARTNLAQVRGARMAAWEAVPEGALVFPVDDDDWFSPDAAEALQARRLPGRTLYHWDASFLESWTTPGHLLYLWKTRLLRTPPMWICSTNNYAVVKSRESEPLFRSHVAASRWVPDHRGQVEKLSGRWSLMNRTVASRTTLGIVRPHLVRGISQRTLLAKYRRYLRIYRQDPGPQLAWARPYIALMGELMAQLHPSGGSA